MLFKNGNFINGKFVAAQSGKVLNNINPATGDIICQLPRSSDEDVDFAVDSALSAFPGWKSTSIEARASLLDRIGDLLEKYSEELAVMESEDSGKTLVMAKAVDIPRAIANFRFFAGAIRHDSGLHTFHMDSAVNYTSREPLGVAGLITPWNLPLYLLSWKVAPALACGNTVVCKPSEITPRTANALAVIFNEAGAPPGIFNVVHGLGGECGNRLVSHPSVRLVSFTGGTATGALVASSSAPLFKRLSLELGGKNATVIFSDTPLGQAVEAAKRAGFTNNGQVCLCGSRVFVQRPLYDAFLEAFGEAVKGLVVGHPSLSSTDVGPLSSAQHKEKVLSYIDSALVEGGVIVAGGPGPVEGLPQGGFYVKPTVISGLNAKTSRAAREEVFGPLVTVHPFDSEAEVIELVNDSKYGLCANVWTKDVNTALRVSKNLSVGIVWVNTWLYRDLRTPFGGMKDSGVGREGGQHSLDFYSELKNTCLFIEK